MQTLIYFTGGLFWALVLLAIVRKIARKFIPAKMEDISGKWIAITGCDSGFGQGLVKALVARGAHVIAMTYTENGSKEALALGAKQAFAFDLTDHEKLQSVAMEIEQQCEGHLWALVHNAGVVLPGFVEYQPFDHYQKSLDVNFLAIVKLTALLLASIKTEKGRVSIVSSVDGLVSLPGNAPYDASKFAVEGYADALSIEMSYWNVHVSVVNPSTMKTPLAMGFFDAHGVTWEKMNQLEPEGSWKQYYSKEWLTKYIEFNRPSLSKIAQDPAITIADLEHSICATKPKYRYLSGRLAKTLFYCLWIMPESWSRVIKKATVNPPPKKI